MFLPFASETYERGKYNLPPQTCLNMFPEKSPIPGRQVMLLPVPGFDVFASVGSGPIRGFIQSDGVLSNTLYVVSGSELYSVTQAGVATLIGSIPGTGLVDMDASGTQIAIASGTTGYVIDASGVNEITDPDFPDVSAVRYNSGLFIWTTANSGQIIWSEVLDATDYDALDFATAENAPDNVLGIHVDHGRISFLGSETIEPWVDTGDRDAPIQPVPSAVINRGIVSRNSVASLDNTFFFVGNDRMVYRMGDSPERISSIVIGEALEDLSYSQLSLVNGWSYTMDDHTFYCLDVPGKSTYVYDLYSQKWHERKSFEKHLWEAHCVNMSRTSDRVFGKVIVGSRDNGNLYILDKTKATYNQDHIERSATAGDIINEGRQIARSVTLDITPGVGTLLPSDLGYDPKIMLQWSDDLGVTWSHERVQKFGKMGKYKTDVTFRRLGRMRAPGRVYRFRVTDPVIFALHGARKDAKIP